MEKFNLDSADQIFNYNRTGFREMPHEPKLSGFIIRLNPEDRSGNIVNRDLFRSLARITESAGDTDSFLFTEMFRVFIGRLDTPEMYADDKSKKCMTANQPNLEDPNVNANIHPHSEKFVIEGRVEGGAYGRKRNKTSTTDKKQKIDVSEGDAITDNFYFFLYSPPFSDKSVLFLQSYTDDTIDTVMKHFFQNFFTINGTFKRPKIEKYIPPSVIQRFKDGATVSQISFTTEVPATTLIGRTRVTSEKFRVEIKITPTDEDLSVDEYGEVIEPIKKRLFASKFKLGSFRIGKGKLKERDGKTSQFDLSTNFDVHPTIILSRFVEIDGSEDDFLRIGTFCFELLDEVKHHVYPSHAVQNRQ